MELTFEWNGKINNCRNIQKEINMARINDESSSLRRMNNTPNMMVLSSDSSFSSSEFSESRLDLLLELCPALMSMVWSTPITFCTENLYYFYSD